jgi:hypothetical protein
MSNFKFIRFVVFDMQQTENERVVFELYKDYKIGDTWYSQTHSHTHTRVTIAVILQSWRLF